MTCCDSPTSRSFADRGLGQLAFRRSAVLASTTTDGVAVCSPSVVVRLLQLLLLQLRHVQLRHLELQPLHATETVLNVVKFGGSADDALVASVADPVAAVFSMQNVFRRRIASTCVAATCKLSVCLRVAAMRTLCILRHRAGHVVRSALPASFVLLSALTMLFSAAPRAEAHAQVERSEPADLSQLTASPRILRLYFTEGIQLKDTSIELVDSKNRPVAGLSGLRIEASGATASAPVVASILLPRLADGIYQATWRTVALDSHVSRGTVVFGVGAVKVAAKADVAESVGTTESLVRFLALVSLFVVCGGSLLLWLRARLVKPSNEMLPMRIGMTICALIVGASVLWLSKRQGSGTISQTGYRLILGILLTQQLLSLFGPSSFWSSIPQRMQRMISAIGIAVFYGATTHHPAAAGKFPLALLAQQVHIVFVSFWGGGCLLLTMLWTAARRSPVGRSEIRSLAVSFARPAIVSVIVVTATGLILTGNGVATVDALIGSLYGRLLIVKLLLVAMAFAFGLRNAGALGHTLAIKSLRRVRMNAGRLTRGLNIETSVIVGALAIAALLGTAPFAVGARWQSANQIKTAQPTISSDLADLVATLTIKPNRPGSNFVNVGMFDTRIPAPSLEKDVTVTLSRPGSPSVVHRGIPSSGDGYFAFVSSDFELSGLWDVIIDVKRSGIAPQSITFPWTVADGLGSGQRATIVSRANIQTPLRWTGVLTALLGAFLYVSTIGRIKRRPKSASTVAAPDIAVSGTTIDEGHARDEKLGDAKSGDE